MEECNQKNLKFSDKFGTFITHSATYLSALVSLKATTKRSLRAKKNLKI